jgi:hypothetical protein
MLGGGAHSRRLQQILKADTELGVTAVLINSVVATLTSVKRRAVVPAFSTALFLLLIQTQGSVNGVGHGNGSHDGSIRFTPFIPEIATSGMIILVFVNMDAARRYRSKARRIVFRVVQSGADGFVRAVRKDGAPLPRGITRSPRVWQCCRHLKSVDMLPSWRTPVW